MSDKGCTRSSSGIWSDKSVSSSSSSSPRQQDDLLSLSSINGSYQMPEEIKLGAAGFLGKVCLHPEQCRLKKDTGRTLLTVSDWKHKLKSLRHKASFDSAEAQIHLRCCAIFKKWLKDLEEKAPSDLEAKLQIYKDWTSVLTKFNENIFQDIENLEDLISELRHTTEAYQFLSHCRRDLYTLMKLISYPLFERRWRLDGIEFRTLEITDVMGLNEKNKCDKEILRELKTDGLSSTRCKHTEELN